MKYIALVAAAALAANISVSKPAQANEQVIKSLCEYVAANDKSRLRKKLKESRLKLRNLFADVQCNGQNMIRFAMSRKADEVGTFITKKIPAKALVASNDIEWANANGFGSSAITAALIARTSS